METVVKFPASMAAVPSVDVAVDHGPYSRLLMMEVDRGPWTMDRGPWTMDHGPYPPWRRPWTTGRRQRGMRQQGLTSSARCCCYERGASKAYSPHRPHAQNGYGIVTAADTDVDSTQPPPRLRTHPRSLTMRCARSREAARIARRYWTSDGAPSCHVMRGGREGGRVGGILIEGKG